MRHVIERVYGLSSWAVYDGESMASGHLVGDDKQWPKDAIGSPGPFFVKTHNLDAALITHPAIHLVRDGRDAIVSHAHYLRSFGGQGMLSLHTLIDKLIDISRPHWGHWGLHTLTWAGRQSPTVHVRFCDLIADPVAVVTSAVDTLGLDLPEDPTADIEDFKQLSKRAPLFFRSGKHEQWRQDMTAKQSDRFAEIHGDALNYYQSLAGSPCLTT